MADQLLKMNGVIIQETPKAILSNALSLVSSDFKYRSKDNLIETLIGVRDLVIDWLTAQGKSATRYIKEKETIQSIAVAMTREQALTFAYNEVLRVDDMGTLPGFCATNKWHDNSNHNPEKLSIVRILN